MADPLRNLGERLGIVEPERQSDYMLQPGSDKLENMSEPRYFQQVTITIDIWAPRGSDVDIHAVADNVQVTACNAVEEAVKAIECPDQGIEVVVK